MIFGLLNVTGVVGGDGDEQAAATDHDVGDDHHHHPAAARLRRGRRRRPRRPGGGVGHRPHRHGPGAPAIVRPRDLHNIADAGFPFTDGVAVRQLVLDDLDALREAAAANGTPLSILAGYRSHERQADLYERRVDELGDSEAGSRVARPGHSEHQLGTTIDVTTEGETDVDQSWGATPNGQWVATNAHEYGFLLSYPLDASERTCYDYEPWHLRYVGPRAGRRGHRRAA